MQEIHQGVSHWQLFGCSVSIKSLSTDALFAQKGQNVHRKPFVQMTGVL